MGPSTLIAKRRNGAIDVGEGVSGGSWAEVPLTWKATFAKQLFPVMDGKVELAPVDARVTRLTVSCMYEPPLGQVGKRLDEALMHIALPKPRSRSSPSRSPSALALPSHRTASG
jgi:hypothetical protein